MNNITGVEINNLLDEKKGKFIVQLRVAKEITYPSGRKRIESNNSQLHRLTEEYEKLTRRSPGFESFVYMFHFVLENAKTETPHIPEAELFEYALDQFEATSSRSPSVCKEICKWCHLPIVIIIEEYALLLAYQVVINEIKIKINNHMLGAIEPENIKDEKKEELEASYFAVVGSNKESVINKIAEFLINEDYISPLDIEIVKQHFHGEYGLPKMNFIKDLSLLIRLLGDISKLFHSELVDKRVKTVRIEPVQQHFTYKGYTISKSNWTKTRNRDKGINGTADHTFRPIEKFILILKKAYCPS